MPAAAMTLPATQRKRANPTLPESCKIPLGVAKIPVPTIRLNTRNAAEITPISRLSEAALACSPSTTYNELVDRTRILCELRKQTNQQHHPPCPHLQTQHRQQQPPSSYRNSSVRSEQPFWTTKTQTQRKSRKVTSKREKDSTGVFTVVLIQRSQR
jgi:hypothetical protein